jgi:hypothetical protein
VGSAGEPGHVDPDLPDQFGRADPGDPGDLSQLLHLAGEWGDQFLDPGLQRADLAADLIFIVLRMSGCGTAPPVGPAGPFSSAGDGEFFVTVTVVVSTGGLVGSVGGGLCAGGFLVDDGIGVGHRGVR